MPIHSAVLPGPNQDQVYVFLTSAVFKHAETECAAPSALEM